MQCATSELLVQGGEQWGADREEEEGEAGGGEEKTQVKLPEQIQKHKQKTFQISKNFCLSTDLKDISIFKKEEWFFINGLQRTKGIDEE